MVSDEELKKIQKTAQRAIQDGSKRLPVTVAMSPVVIYLMSRELLLRREKEPWILTTIRTELIDGDPGDG